MEEEDVESALWKAAQFLGAILLSPVLLMGALERVHILHPFDHFSQVAVVTAPIWVLLGHWVAIIQKPEEGVVSRIPFSWLYAFALINSFFLCMAFVFFINGKYDTSPAQTYTLPIVGKIYQVGHMGGRFGVRRCTEYRYFRAIVKPSMLSSRPAEFDEDMELIIESDEKDYNCNKKDSFVGEQFIPAENNAEIVIREGFFGIPWRESYRFVKKAAP